MIQDHPVAIQLRFLQTAVEIAAENNSTMVFPIPMDLFKPIVEAGERLKSSGGGSASPADPSKTLAAPESEIALPPRVDPPIPSGLDPAMLTDAAKALLGIGSGESSAGEKAVPSIPEADEGEND